MSAGAVFGCILLLLALVACWFFMALFDLDDLLAERHRAATKEQT